MTIVVCPTFDTVTEAIEWLDERGCVSFHLRRGPDGKIRGHGLKDIAIPGLVHT